MIKIKAYHKEEKQIYKVANINYDENTVTIIKDGKYEYFHDSNVILYPVTRYFTEKNDKKRYIYLGDFIIASTKNHRVSGVVVAKKSGLVVLKNSKLSLEIPLEILVEDGYKIVNLYNANMYFQSKTKK